VLIRKAFRYRIYPTAEQISRLRAWQSALRFLWNLAHEQRLMGLARTDKRHPTAFNQINELTDLRSELPWLADVPRNVCAQLLVELDKAWQRCLKRLGRTPRWKRKGRDSLGLIEPHPKAWRLDGSVLRFPKLGNLRAVVHWPLEGKPKTCTIREEAGQWFASILCEIEVVDPAPRTEPVVAIDRGVVNLIGDSDGRLIPNPAFYERALKRLAQAQCVVSRRKKGSKNREKAKARVAVIHRKVRRQREHVLHELSATYAKSHGTVVLEKLRTKDMIRVGKGLARRIADAGWGRFGVMLGYKLGWSGGSLVEVEPAYSSQECSACGHVAAENRVTQAEFRCVACGHHEHADLNAPKVLKRRANRSVLPVDGNACKEPGRSRKRLRCPRRLSESSAL
jgi:putative transposase